MNSKEIVDNIDNKNYAFTGGTINVKNTKPDKNIMRRLPLTSATHCNPERKKQVMMAMYGNVLKMLIM